jgi:hypothetical protein
MRSPPELECSCTGGTGVELCRRHWRGVAPAALIEVSPDEVIGAGANSKDIEAN